MGINSQLTVAVHILALLTANKKSLLSSKVLANSVNTNPVVIRRILRGLSQAGLVITQLGVEGGTKLARLPQEITLLDVYEIFGQKELFTLHHNQPNSECPCGRTIQPILKDVFSEAQLALEAVLAQTTIADVVEAMEQALGTPCTELSWPHLNKLSTQG